MRAAASPRARTRRSNCATPPRRGRGEARPGRLALDTTPDAKHRGRAAARVARDTRCVKGWEITFRFAGGPKGGAGVPARHSGLTIGEISGIDKKGWEYLWVRYADAEDAAAKALVKKPIAAYIEQVYAEGDFSLLGI